jgi:hypothetical protein
MKTPAVILQGVSCKALYSGQRMFCPRGIHHWWREVWLERASSDPLPSRQATRVTVNKVHRTPAVLPAQDL